MKKIFHVYGNEINLGDWGSALGIKQLLESASEEEIEYRNWHTSFEQNQIGEKTVSRINKECDAVVIGGGGLLFKKQGASNKWPLGMLINISRKNLERLKVPIFVFSIGLNQDLEEKKGLFQRDYDGIHFDRNQIDSIRHLNEISELFSVRDAGTRDFLEKIKCQKEAWLAPCPSMFLSTGTKPLQGSKDRAVGINLRGNAQAQLEGKVGQIIPRLKEKGFEISFLSHNRGKGEGMNSSEKYSVKTVVSENPLELVKNYEKMDFTIGMRGHSNMLSFGAAKPFVSLSYNIKNDFFAGMAGMEEYLLPSNGKWSAEEFMGVFSKMVEDKARIKKNFKGLKNKFQKMDRAFAKKVIDSI